MMRTCLAHEDQEKNNLGRRNCKSKSPEVGNSLMGTRNKWRPERLERKGDRR